MNHNGREPVMFFAFFVLLIIIGAGIGAGVLLFYGARYDTRATETGIIFDKVSACAKNNDFFSSNFNIEQCGLFEGAFGSEHLVYLKNEEGVEKYFGNYDFIVECELEGLKEREDAPLCLKGDVEGEFGNYQLIVGSKQISRRVLS